MLLSGDFLHQPLVHDETITRVVVVRLGGNGFLLATGDGVSIEVSSFLSFKTWRNRVPESSSGHNVV